MPQRFTVHQTAKLGLYIVWDKVMVGPVATFDLSTSAIALCARLNKSPVLN